MDLSLEEAFHFIVPRDEDEYESSPRLNLSLDASRHKASKRKKSPKRGSPGKTSSSSGSPPKRPKVFSLAFDKKLHGHRREKPHFTSESVPDAGPLKLADSISVPGSINKHLRDYQRDGVKFLYERFKIGEGGILADDMGLGKTVQIIAFLSAIYKKWGDERDLERLKSDFEKQLEAHHFDVPASTSTLNEEEEEPDKDRDDMGVYGPTLIIAPLSVIPNWESEFETWSFFCVKEFHGKQKDETLSFLNEKRVEIVLTTFETARDSMEDLDKHFWKCVIVDEVHKIKSDKSKMTQIFKQMSCGRRYGLTGTPLQNDMTELWCLLDWANPGCLGTAEDFIERFGIPLEKGQQHNARKRQLATSEKSRTHIFWNQVVGMPYASCLEKKELGDLRDQWMIRRTKDLIKDQLPAKTDEVVLCQMSEMQGRAYENVLKCPDMALVLQQWDVCDCGRGKQKGKCCFSTNSGGEKVKSLMLALLQVLLKVSNHMSLVLPGKRDSKAVYSDEEVEELCFRGDEEYFSQLSATPRLHYVSQIKNSGKMRALEKLLDHFYNDEDKVLIFSYSVKLLDALEGFVKRQKYRFRRLDGATKSEERFNVVSEFNRDPSIFLFLISTKAGGVGLNITGANRVIVFDPNWNPSHDLQAQDRAYRLGQTRDVAVYRLITAGTLEEIIYLRQVHKQHLDKVAVSSEGALRLFDRRELFGFKKMIQLRTGKESLTQKFLKRKESIRKKLIGLETAPYSGFEGSESLIESAQTQDDHGAEFICQHYSWTEDEGQREEEVEDSTGITQALRSSSGVVHLHRNRDLVEADCFEDHITRCAVRAVKDGDLGYDKATDHCDPITLQLSDEDRKTLEDKLNKPRKLSIGDATVLLYGQTPSAAALTGFEKMAAANGLTSEEFSSQVVAMSTGERLKCLANFYSVDIPQSSDLFDEISRAFEAVVNKESGQCGVRRSRPPRMSPERERAAEDTHLHTSTTEPSMPALDRLLGLDPGPEEESSSSTPTPPPLELEKMEPISALDRLLNL